MKFNYKRYSNNVLRPVIPITIEVDSNTITYEVLVDSGADLCIFHAEIADLLGIKLTEGTPQEVFGVGGKASIYYLHMITINVGGWKYKIKAGFMPNVSGNVMHYGLVGQRGFFENFIVKFDLQKEEVEIKTREK